MYFFHVLTRVKKNDVKDPIKMRSRRQRLVNLYFSALRENRRHLRTRRDNPTIDSEKRPILRPSSSSMWRAMQGSSFVHEGRSADIGIRRDSLSEAIRQKWHVENTGIQISGHIARNLEAAFWRARSLCTIPGLPAGEIKWVKFCDHIFEFCACAALEVSRGGSRGRLSHRSHTQHHTLPSVHLIQNEAAPNTA